MSSETKPYGWVRDDGALAFERSATFCTPVYLHPPTPPADGEVDFAAADFAADIVARLGQPEMKNLARAYLALRARPLPDDVRAVVERVQKLSEFWDDGEEWLVDELTPNALRFIAADLRTLLAHLTRGAP